MKVVDATDLAQASARVVSLLKEYAQRVGGHPQDLYDSIILASSVDLTTGGLMAMGALCMYQHLIPGAAEALERVAIPGKGVADVKA